MTSPIHPPILYIARLVLEARTPLSISTGNPDGVFDTALVRDANQLPALPGTSLAGVLRSLWASSAGTEIANVDHLFGFQHRDTGMASRLHIGWGHLLDSTGRALCGLALEPAARQRLQDDPLFVEALRQRDAPEHRNRVRLTHKGAAADTGKFDRTVLPAGNRFAVELRLWADADDDGGDWRHLRGLLTHPGLRLGGGTRAGLGAMNSVALHTLRLDLRSPAAAQQLAAIGADPSCTRGFDPHPIDTHPAQGEGWLHAEIKLDAQSLWRIGQGSRELEQARTGKSIGTDGKIPDLLPLTDRRVLWTNGTGCIAAVPELLVPAASIKGVLAHRMTFHACRFENRWADDTSAAAPTLPGAVRALFGEVKADNAQAAGHAGCLFIDDAWLALRERGHHNLMHNSVDRFTGGVRAHMLFEEQNVFKGQIRLRLVIDLKRLASLAAHLGTSVAETQAAFLAALRDLCEGRLAIGSRSTSGNGFVRGELPQTLTTPWPATDTRATHLASVATPPTPAQAAA